MKEKSLNKNRIYYLIYNVLNIAFPLLTGIYVARMLLPETIGTVTYAQNVVSYFVIFSFFGIPTYGVREMAKVRDDQEGRNKLFTELFIINLISTCVFLVVYLAMIFTVEQFRSQMVLFLVVGILLALNALNISWLYEGLEEFGFISARNLIFKMVSFLFLVLFVREDSDYLLYALVTVVGTAGNYIINVICAPKFAHLTFKGLAFKQHMKPILYLVAVNLAIEIYSLVDVTMLGNLCIKDEVAYYSYASKIQKILLQVLNSFTIVIVPRLSMYYKREMEKFNAVIVETLKLLFLLSIPTVVGCWIVGNDMVVILYGSNYIKSGMILKILTMILLVSPTGYLLGSRVMLVSGNENKMLTSVALGAVTNVILNAILIPRLGGTGAAWASLLGELVVMSVYLNFGLRIVSLKGIGKTMIKYIISAGLMGVAVFVVGMLDLVLVIGLMVKVGAGCIVYFGMLMILKEEFVLGMFKKVFRRIGK